MQRAHILRFLRDRARKCRSNLETASWLFIPPPTMMTSYFASTKGPVLVVLAPVGCPTVSRSETYLRLFERAPSRSLRTMTSAALERTIFTFLLRVMAPLSLSITARRGAGRPANADVSLSTLAMVIMYGAKMNGAGSKGVVYL